MQERHFLEPLSQGPKSQFSFGVYDVETFGVGNLELQLVGAFDGSRYRVFRDMRSFFMHVLDKRYEGWRWFAHYGGRFDIRFILETIKDIHPRSTFQFIVSGSSIINLTIIKRRAGKERKWHFCDSGRLLPANLARLTKEFDVEHKKLDFAPESVEYNEHDCRGLYEVLDRFFGMYGICSETIASHAMRIYRTRFLPRRIPIVHEDVEEFVRSCYYGGRCEVFRWDEADVGLYDINSMYPWAMLGWIPVAYRARSMTLPDSDEQGIGFYEADVQYPEHYAPCLPWYHDKLYFPTGRMTVRASSMELRQAIEDGATVKIRRGCVFDVDKIFVQYVNEIYGMKRNAREKGDAATEYVAKLLLNSLYGKFGQRRDQKAYALDPGTCFLHGDTGPRIWPMESGNSICYYFTKSTSAHILPHIAATITARARLQILRFIRSSDKVWYTDTDSVFTQDSLVTSSELGDMDFEGSGPFRAYGVKDYWFQGKPKIKGIPITVTDEKTGKKSIDYSKAIEWRDHGRVQYARMAGIMESLRAGKSPLRYIDVVKVRRVIVPKRAPDGPVDTRPWTVLEILEKTVKKSL